MEETKTPYAVQLFAYALLPVCLVSVTLKLFHLVDWSWWWVFAPLWVPVAVLILFVILLAITGRIKIISKKD